jgi:hypothetical protein
MGGRPSDASSLTGLIQRRLAKVVGLDTFWIFRKSYKAQASSPILQARQFLKGTSGV